MNQIKSNLIVSVSACWSKQVDVHGPGGVPHKLTLSQCKAACIRDITCVAIDWEPKNIWRNHCWLLKSTVIGPTTEPGHIEHYQLYRNCIRESYPHTLIMYRAT